MLESEDLKKQPMFVWGFFFLGGGGNKESERALVILNSPTSLYIYIDYLGRGGTSIDSSIERWSHGARGKFLNV